MNINGLIAANSNVLAAINLFSVNINERTKEIQVAEKLPPVEFGLAAAKIYRASEKDVNDCANAISREQPTIKETARGFIDATASALALSMVFDGTDTDTYKKALEAIVGTGQSLSDVAKKVRELHSAINSFPNVRNLQDALAKLDSFTQEMSDLSGYATDTAATINGLDVTNQLSQ